MLLEPLKTACITAGALALACLSSPPTAIAAMLIVGGVLGLALHAYATQESRDTLRP